MKSVIDSLSKFCPRNFTRVRKEVIYMGLLSLFPLTKLDEIYLKLCKLFVLFVIV